MTRVARAVRPFLAPLLCAAILLIPLPSRPALAFSLRTGNDGQVLLWTQPSVEVVIDTTGLPSVGGAADAVRAGFVAWTAAGVPTRLHFKVQAKGTGAVQDGRNVVLWEGPLWRWGQNVVAMTVTTYSRTSGAIVETDVVLNARDYTWSVGTGAAASAYDIQDVAAHEAGHFLGLGHSADPEATMYATTPPGETKKRSLSSDDRLAVVALVTEMQRRRPGQAGHDGAVAQSVETQTSGLAERTRLDCAVGGSPAGAAWVLLLGLVALMTRLRRRLRHLP